VVIHAIAINPQAYAIHLVIAHLQHVRQQDHCASR
jgi:hypothetical protein